MTARLNTDFRLTCVAACTAQEFTRRSGLPTIELMISEALTYYHEKLKTGMTVIAFSHDRSAYRPLSDEPYFPDQVRLSLRCTNMPLRVLMEMKRSAKLPSIEALNARIFALYHRILEAREKGDSIGLMDEKNQEFYELQITPPAPLSAPSPASSPAP